MRVKMEGKGHSIPLAKVEGGGGGGSGGEDVL